MVTNASDLMLVSHLLTTNVVLLIKSMLKNTSKNVFFLQNRLDKSMLFRDKTTFVAKKWDTNTKSEALVTV